MNQRKKTKTKTTWWISYIIVFLLPLLASVMVFLNILGSFKEEVRASNQAVIDIIRLEMDAVFENTNLVVNEIFLNSSLSTAKTIDKEDINANFRYNLWKIISNELPAYVIKNQLVRDLLVYLPRSGLFLEEHSYYDLDRAYENFEDSGLTPDEFLAIVSGTYKNGFIAMPNTQCSYFLYINSFQTSTGGSDLNVIIKASKRAIGEIIQNVDWIEESHYFVINQQNQIVMSVSGNSAVPETILAISDWKDRSEITIEQVDYLVERSQSANGLIYLCLVPIKLLNSRITYLITLFAIIWVICILLGILLTRILINRNFAPVANILKYLGSRSDQVASRNAFDAILSGVRQAVDENADLANRLNVARVESGSALLMKYLNSSSLLASDIRAQLTAYQVTFDYDRFMIVLFGVSGGNGMDPTEEMVSLRSRDQFVVRNILEERLASSCQSCQLDTGGYLASIICLKPEQNHTDIINLIQDTRRFITDHTTIDMVVAASNEVAGFSLLPQAYREVMELLTNSFLSSSNQLILSANERPEGRPASYNLNEEAELLSAIRNGDVKAACTIVDNVLDHADTGKVSPVMASCLVFDLISTLIKATKYLPDSDDLHDFIEEEDYIRKIRYSHQISDTRKQLTDMIENLCAKVQAARLNRSTILQSRIEALVADQLFNPSMGNAYIADQLNINASYLSRIFKSQYGVGVTEYINRLRIMKAKKLLTNGKLKIAEVATAVGFTNDITFIRIFKKYEGLPPGQYRKEG